MIFTDRYLYVIVTYKLVIVNYKIFIVTYKFWPLVLAIDIYAKIYNLNMLDSV